MRLPEKSVNNKANPAVSHTYALAAILATHDTLLDHHPDQIYAVLGLLANTAANAEAEYQSIAC